MRSEKNVDPKTAHGFADELLTHFDKSGLSTEERKMLLEHYFFIFPWHIFPDNASGFGLACTSLCREKLVAPQVGQLHCVAK